MGHCETATSSRDTVTSLFTLRDVERIPQALGFENLDPFFRASKQGLCFTALEEDGGDKRLVELELAFEADGIALPDSV